MAIPFSNSIRSLQSERDTPALISVIFAISLLALWLAWFFSATIAHYVRGAIVVVTPEGRIVAEFPATLRTVLHLGQPATIQLDRAPSVAQETTPTAQSSAPALIADISDGDPLQVTFDPQTDLRTLVSDPTTLVGEVEIVVNHISPARYLLTISDSPSR